MSADTRHEFAGHISAADTIISVVEAFAKDPTVRAPEAVLEVTGRVRADLRLLHEWLVSGLNTNIEKSKS